MRKIFQKRHLRSFLSFMVFD